MKAQSITLLFYTPWEICLKKYQIVSEITYISVSVLYRLIKKAFDNKFNPKKDFRIKKHYITPIKLLNPKRTAISEEIANKIIKLIIKDRNSRE